MAKANINKIKGEMHKSIIIVENMKTILPIVDKTKVPKKRKEKDLSNIIYMLDLKANVEYFIQHNRIHTLQST